MSEPVAIQAALFRSCLRKEYQDQVVKMLRGLNGEFTRTTYRLQWIEQAVLDALREGSRVQFVGTIVDQQGVNGIPVRLLQLEDFAVNEERQVVELVLSLGDFVCEKESEAVERPLSELTGGSTSRPPETFVAIWADTWREVKKVDDARAGDVWRRSIDFLSTRWRTEKTIFFRPETSWCVGAPYGPKSEATQLYTKRLVFDSYNPHIASSTLRKYSLVPQSTGLLVESLGTSSIPADGMLHVDIEFLESGSGSVRVEVHPDPQWSTYVPIDFEVAPNEDAGTDRVRHLGVGWRKFLQVLDDRFASGPLEHAELLDLLLDVFEDNPELIIHRGRLHLANSEYRMAADQFVEALRKTSDPRAIAGQLIAALHLGELSVAESALQRLDLSKVDLFEEVLEGLPRVSGTVVREFCHAPGIVLSEAKAMQMLHAFAAGDHAESVFTAIFKEASELNFQEALRMALGLIGRHPEWRMLRQAVVGVADRRGAIDEVQSFVSDALRWRGEDPEGFGVEFFRIGAALPAEVSTTLACENAARLFAAATRGAVLTGFELAGFAAETAFQVGNLSIAQRAIHMTLANVHKWSSLLGHHTEAYRQRAIAVSELIVAVENDVPGLAEATIRIDPVKRQKVMDELVGRVVVVFGGNADSTVQQQIKEQLERDWHAEEVPAKLRWLPWRDGRQPSATEVKQIDAARSILVVSAPELKWLTPLMRDWLVGEGVPQVISNLNFREIIFNLSNYFDIPQSVIPSFKSCAEVIVHAEQEFKNLLIGSQVSDFAADLDQKKESASWARRVYVALQALNDYGEARRRTPSPGAFRSWAASNGKFTASQIKDRESDATMSDPTLRALRVFQVPSEVDASGAMEMQSHIAIGVTSGCPRIYFYTGVIDQIGKVCVGYVGPHLRTASGY
jgi:hypothetical protein